MCDGPEEMFGRELNQRNILFFVDFWSCVRTDNFFCHVLDLKKCFLVSKKKKMKKMLTAAERLVLVLRFRPEKKYFRASVPVLREILTVHGVCEC